MPITKFEVQEGYCGKTIRDTLCYHCGWAEECISCSSRLCIGENPRVRKNDKVIGCKSCHVCVCGSLMLNGAVKHSGTRYCSIMCASIYEGGLHNDCEHVWELIVPSCKADEADIEFIQPKTCQTCYEYICNECTTSKNKCSACQKVKPVE